MNARRRAEILALRTVAERLDACISENGKLPDKGAWRGIALEIAASPEALYCEIAVKRRRNGTPYRIAIHACSQNDRLGAASFEAGAQFGAVVSLVAEQLLRRLQAFEASSSEWLINRAADAMVSPAAEKPRHFQKRRGVFQKRRAKAPGLRPNRSAEEKLMRRPRFIADQARHAKGPLGRLIAFIMARETAGPNRRAIDELDVPATDDVLDVGCGPGAALAELAASAIGGRVAGIDPSPLMVRLAQRRNAALIDQGRVTVTRADISVLPFPDSSFDKALCVHVIYFWNDLDHGLREIARVLKPGGRLAMLFRSSDDQRSPDACSTNCR